MVKDASKAKPGFRRAVKTTSIVAGLSLWTVVGFMGTQLIVQLISGFVSVYFDGFLPTSEVFYNSILVFLGHTLSVVVVIGVPLWLYKRRTSLKDLGLHRWPNWSELGLAVLGYLAAVLLGAVLVQLASSFVPGFDANQVQDIGFNSVFTRSDLILTLIAVAIVAPITEEVLFRGYLYGKLNKYIAWWGAALITSVIFGLVHGQWNVAIATASLGFVAAGLRFLTGSLWPSIFVHIINNSVACYLLYINPIF